MRSWWAVSRQSNVLLVYFADLKNYPGGEMCRVAEFPENPEMSSEE